MTLGVHIVIAGAAASPFFAHPLISLLVGLLSHYISDTIPHWDWPSRSVKKNPETGKLQAHFTTGNISIDVAKAFLDVTLGGMVLFGVVWGHSEARLLVGVFAAGLGGILPDILQFFYCAVRREPLITHQRFHDFMHTRVRIPAEQSLIGPLLQLPFVLLAAGVLMLVVW